MHLQRMHAREHTRTHTCARRCTLTGPPYRKQSVEISEDLLRRGDVDGVKCRLAEAFGDATGCHGDDGVHVWMGHDHVELTSESLPALVHAGGALLVFGRFGERRKPASGLHCACTHTGGRSAYSPPPPPVTPPSPSPPPPPDPNPPVHPPTHAVDTNDEVSRITAVPSARMWKWVEGVGWGAGDEWGGYINCKVEV
jgi:hypothetical protein